MGRYLLRRLALALLLIVLVSSAALVITDLAPGDITTERALNLDADARNRLRAQMGLDRSLASQYVAWLGGLARFDFGQSLLYTRPVRDLLGERAANTAILALSALVVSTLIGLPLGLYTGSRPRGRATRIVRGVSVVCLSMPPLIGSLGLVLLAARTGWLPVGGMSSSGADEMTWAARVWDLLFHLPVPVLALALPLAAALERLQSQALVDALREPSVTASLARGVSPLRALLRHAWPAALRPVLGVYGVMIGGLFSGSFVVEVVTAWPGLGRLMFDALKARDLYLVAGCAASGAVFLAVGTGIADLLLAWIDPRVRSEAGV